MSNNCRIHFQPRRKFVIEHITHMRFIFLVLEPTISTKASETRGKQCVAKIARRTLQIATLEMRAHPCDIFADVSRPAGHGLNSSMSSRRRFRPAPDSPNFSIAARRRSRQAAHSLNCRMSARRRFHPAVPTLLPIA